MESLSHEERSGVLKFVSGRLRLPCNFKVEWQVRNAHFAAFTCGITC